MPQRMVEVDLLDDGTVILTKEDLDEIMREGSGVYNASTFKEAVLVKKRAKGSEWQMERGPDSELGREMEAGGPQETNDGQ